MMSEEKNAFSPLSDKEMLVQDLKTVDMMTRWRKKLSKGEHIKVKIMDKGMMPTMNIGDIAEIMPVHTSNLKPNNVIFFRQNETFVVRRILECIYSGSGEFRAKGDNQTEPEPLVTASQILGKVISIERDGQRIELEKTLSSALGQLNKKFGGAGNVQIGSGQELEKGKEIASNIMSKIVELIDKAYSMIISGIDKIVAMMTGSRK